MMHLFLNDSQTGIAIERLNNRLFGRNANPGIDVSLSIDGDIDATIELLLTLSDIPITHVAVEYQDQVVYDVHGSFMIEDLLDTTEENGQRNMYLSLLRI